MYSCTIPAFWQTSRYEITMNKNALSVHTYPEIDTRLGKPGDSSPITMTLDGIPSFHSTDFSRMFTNNFSIEEIVAAAFATALSEIRDGNKFKLIPDQPMGSDYSRFELQITQSGYRYNISATPVCL